MKLNEQEALLTSKILLVPYSSHHVPTYHTWMQDPELQEATASEPLTLPEEYAMQKSWRTDADKLTFIACTTDARSDDNSSVEYICAGKDDAERAMIGDVNLFLTPDKDEEENDLNLTESANPKPTQEKRLQHVIGEVEIMIAAKTQQGKGLGREILLTFMWYILTSLNSIMDEYHRSHGQGMEASKLKYLRVKIGKGNARSIRLFESVGFRKVAEEPNYFGELELRWDISASAREDVETESEKAPMKLAYKS